MRFRESAAPWVGRLGCWSALSGERGTVGRAFGVLGCAFGRGRHCGSGVRGAGVRFRESAALWVGRSGCWGALSGERGTVDRAIGVLECAFGREECRRGEDVLWAAASSGGASAEVR
ncbi:hypothetical protein GCM10009547_17030 [Sporichthya brevicatena]|uniref:Uncharacterized protein n=1 Tax=Sporichthya brevicatena TaxID=171442 RepID=A0ABN1GPD7_9ACTN